MLSYMRELFVLVAHLRKNDEGPNGRRNTPEAWTRNDVLSLELFVHSHRVRLRTEPPARSDS